MNIPEFLREMIATPMADLIYWGVGLSIFYLSSNLLLVAVWHWLRRRTADGKSMPGFWQYIFPKDVFLHRSSIFDYKFYIFIRMLKPLTYGAVFACGAYISNLFAGAMALVFGPPPQVADTSLWRIAVETVVLFLTFDCAYWVAHMLMHKVRWLWEFHKGHHAAEVMTPFTVLRMHPFEEFESGFFVISATGIAHILLSYIFGTTAPECRVIGVNIIMLGFYITIFNLRHSHIWLPLTGFWGYLIHSPAHHQLHHSNDPQHYGKNMGFCLSIWDWLFGTLIIPGKEPITQLGIGSESATFNKFWPFLYMPFVNCYRMWFGKQRELPG